MAFLFIISSYLIAFCIMILLAKQTMFNFPKLEDLLINGVFVAMKT